MNNKSQIISVVCLLASINLAIAGEKIDKKLDASDLKEVEIHNNRGSVEITGWDKEQIVVKGELDDLTEKFVFSNSGDKALIKVVLPHRNFNSRSGKGSKLKIYVPRNVAVQFGGVATDLKISDLNNGVDIGSVSGNITLKSINGKGYINSVSGKIDVKQLTGRMEITTVSGDVKATVSSKRISVGGVSSDISITTEAIESIAISTVSGDAKVYGRLLEDGSIKLSNVSGDSYYYAMSGLNARVALETGPGGDVINKYSDDKPTSSFIGSEKLKFTAGNGEGLIRMSTVSGEIGLKSGK